MRRLFGHRFVAFGIHEAADYLFGGGLAFTGVHASGRMGIYLLVLGVLWCLLGVVTDGALSIFKVLSRTVHGYCDLVLVLALALSPLAALGQLDPVAVGVGEGIALVMARISLWTMYTPAPQKAVATAARPAEAAMASPRYEGAARVLGRGAGQMKRRATAAGSQAGPALERSARRLGRAIGSVRRSRGQDCETQRTDG